MALPSPWRVVNSLLTLRDQINHVWPDRAKGADGTVADAAHSSTSDHYPHHVDALGANYVVTALDITNDPAHGVYTDVLAATLVAGRDPRIKYVIAHSRIASNPSYSHASDNWGWRPYDGSDPHTNHMHVSVLDAPIADSTIPWRFAPGTPPPGGGRVSTLDQDDIVNVASAVIQWATTGGALRSDLAGAQFNVKAVAETLYHKLDSLSVAPVDFTAADVANLLVTDERFPAILTGAFESALARVRVIVDPAI